jgi:uncharacterized 2Fe-2S/4Fe-4S cluster protein (DUF4445 family)
MKISVPERGMIYEAGAEETVLSALAGAGAALPAPCGGRHICKKCGVVLVQGAVRGDVPDESGMFLACRGIPVTDITVKLPEYADLTGGQPEYAAYIPGRPLARTGAALDIGTTTVQARLIDLDTGRTLETCSELNGQRVFGADVMSRINAARNGKTGELFRLINRQTGSILNRFRRNSGAAIEKLAVSGNTTMLHLFTNTDPSGMGALPFTPVFLEERELSGGDLSLPAERITLLPSISAFIGSDIVSGIAALDMLHGAPDSLLIDIGTNGEIALLHGGAFTCCSAAAGPAFEGAAISCGAGNIPGAVNSVTMLNGKVSFTTLGGLPPRGLCGCGLIDAAAVMVKAGILDETGALREDCAGGFEIAPGVKLNNRDIRQFQLAKSAILSGIKILCKNAGLELSRIHTVFIAGGLGFFINKENAVTAGLLPEAFLDKITVCGNTSLEGARLALRDPSFLRSCNEIRAKSSLLELAADPSFMDEFAGNMLFNP